MNYKINTNPILPAAGVRRKSANKIRTNSQERNYDAASLNPSGRDVAEKCEESKAKLLKSRKHTKIATFNIRTLAVKNVNNELDKTGEMVWNMRKYGIDICGIQEH